MLCLPQSSVYGISSAYIHLELLDFSRVFRSMPSRHLWLRSDTPHHTFLCPRHYEWVWCRFPHLRQVGGVFWFVPCEYNGVATHSLLRWYRPLFPSLPPSTPPYHRLRLYGVREFRLGRDGEPGLVMAFSLVSCLAQQAFPYPPRRTRHPYGLPASRATIGERGYMRCMTQHLGSVIASLPPPYGM